MVTNKPPSLISDLNGLYATTVGIGGITIIETFKMLADSKLALTRLAAATNKESMTCQNDWFEFTLS